MSIRELAEVIAKAYGFPSRFVLNTEQPNSTLHKVSDVTKTSAFRWRASIALRPGIASAHHWLIDTIAGREANCPPGLAPTFS